MNLSPTATVVLLALGLAIQPWAILAAVVLVSAQRGVAKALAFLIGWMLALAAIGYLGVLLHPQVAKRQGSTPAALYVVDVCAGLVLVAWLVWQWRRGPVPVTSQPGWITRVDTMGPLVALGLGVFLPNYLFVAAAVNQMLEIHLDTAQLAAAVAMFVLVASLGVAVPLILIVVTPRHATRVNGTARTWLVAHTRVVTLSIGWLIAVVLLVKGLQGLAG